jgi:hypothetical protein
VLVESNIGSDIGGTTAEDSENELQISFDVLAAADNEKINNQANITWEGFDVPSKNINGGGATEVIIPKGFKNLVRTGGWYISQVYTAQALYLILAGVLLLHYQSKFKKQK